MNQQVLEQILRELVAANSSLAWHSQVQTYLLAAPGKFESKRLCSDKRIHILR
jgi:hypothetical protein